ncbi:MAG TPA: hypothetical protein VH591_15105, partial [Ktedonobacterales bacterium]
DYNYRRVHGSLGVTPMQRCAALADETPLWDDVAATFDHKREKHYVDLLILQRMKRARARAAKK